ncbi:MAG TPA: hypothetical protein PLX02_14725 [Syntrophorhabdaceae bacterium]|nr:hypothetical protein [Syntrophorhabdaceae bacterium]HQM82861.1 hypothetical protein [Syntrophorhabdaceae bacterium]
MEKADITKVVASNLTVAAALIQLAKTTKGISTTSEGDSEAINIFLRILDRLKKEAT